MILPCLMIVFGMWSLTTSSFKISPAEKLSPSSYGKGQPVLYGAAPGI